MAGSLNRVCLIGNLGRDPETRRTQSGSAVVSFSMACTESWRDKQSGERRDKTEWFQIVIWNEGLGKVAEQYLRKGSKVYIEGKLRTREYQDKDGNDRKAVEVVLEAYQGGLILLGDGRGGDGEDRGERRSGNGGGRSTGGGRREPAPIDDDIPF